MFPWIARRALREAVRTARNDCRVVTDRAQIESQLHEARDLGWLIWAIDRAALTRISDEALLERVAVLNAPGRRELLDELQRRVPSWPPDRHEALLSALVELDSRYSSPGPEAQCVDRLVMRFLHATRATEARAFADLCAVSGRRRRRWAAWRFYGRWGVDEHSTAILVRSFSTDPEPRLARLIASTPELIAPAGLGAVLAITEEFYWRGRAFEAALAAEDPAVDRLAPNYPAEALFALRRAGRRDRLHQARCLFDANRDKPEVLSCAIRAFAELGARTELDLALATADDLLARTDNPFLSQRPRIPLGAPPPLD
jgi:hypothetical protein